MGKDWALLVEAALALCLARVQLAGWPMARLLAGIDAPAAGPRAGSSVAGNIDPRVLRVRRGLGAVAARLPWHSSCLVQALAARRMLARRRVANQLTIGVKRDGGGVAAHAWVLSADGHIVVGAGEAETMQPIAALPGLARD